MRRRFLRFRGLISHSEPCPGALDILYSNVLNCPYLLPSLQTLPLCLVRGEAGFLWGGERRWHLSRPSAGYLSPCSGAFFSHVTSRHHMVELRLSLCRGSCVPKEMSEITGMSTRAGHVQTPEPLCFVLKQRWPDEAKVYPPTHPETGLRGGVWASAVHLQNSPWVSGVLS